MNKTALTHCRRMKTPKRQLRILVRLKEKLKAKERRSKGAQQWLK